MSFVTLDNTSTRRIIIIAPMPREGCMITRRALSGDIGVIAARTITQDCIGALSLNISAEPGQRIQLTFHDLSTSSGTTYIHI